MKAPFGIACWQRPYIVHDKTLVNNTMWCGQWPGRRPGRRLNGRQAQFRTLIVGKMQNQLKMPFYPWTRRVAALIKWTYGSRFTVTIHTVRA
jgi:hypothetical protein